MLEKIIKLLFSCSHKRITLPITPVSKRGGPAGQAYVVCLDCGGQFAYDWKEMRMGARLGSESSAAENRGWLARLLRRAD